MCDAAPFCPCESAYEAERSMSKMVSHRGVWHGKDGYYFHHVRTQKVCGPYSTEADAMVAMDEWKRDKEQGNG